MKHAYRQNRVKMADINGQIEDNLSGIRVVKSFSNESIEMEKFREGNDRFLATKRNSYLYMGTYNSVLNAMLTGVTIAVVLVGAKLITTQSMQITDLITFLLYVANFTEPVKKLINFTEQFQNGYSGYSRFREIMDIEPDIADKKNAEVLTDVKGDVDVRNQAIHLKELSMKGMGATMKTTLLYRAARPQAGYAGFDFRLHDVNIGHLVDFVPSLDSIVPMLRSFEGMVDFNVAASSAIDSCFNLKIPSLRSAIHIKGDSLVLMDGETFAEISKKFLFKNKERNLIDSIAVNISVQDGHVTVYPFVIQMDRYRAAVGGTQDLAMNFDRAEHTRKPGQDEVRLGQSQVQGRRNSGGDTEGRQHDCPHGRSDCEGLPENHATIRAVP